MPLAEAIDQAAGLRRLFSPEPAFRSLGVLGPDCRATARAGVALARGLSRRGERVLVVDEARSPHHVGGLMGVMTRHTLAEAGRRGLLDIVQQAGEGVVLMAAPDGLEALAGMDEADLRDLTDDWRTRAEPPEWLLLNGGQRSPDTSLAAAAQTRVLVLPGTRTRLADAYAVMKKAQAVSGGRAWWVLVDGAAADQAQILFAALGETARRFLGIVPEFLGHLPRDPVGAATASLEAGSLDRLAGDAAGEQQVDFARFWQHMWLHSRMAAESVGV